MCYVLVRPRTNVRLQLNVNKARLNSIVRIQRGANEFVHLYTAPVETPSKPEIENRN